MKKNIKIDYNIHNLPMTVTTPIVAGTNSYIYYTYTANGAKLTTNTNYIGEIVYKNNVLSYIITPEGRAVPKTGGFDYEYDLRDHLGSTRITCKAATYDANNNVTSITVVQKNSYYPFGILHGGKLTVATNRYLYNGKELQSDYNFDLYDYGFRFYDPQLGRFTGIDPIAEKYAFVTPYNYAENSPIACIDLWGLQAKFAADGSFLGWGKITGSSAPVWLNGNPINGINVGQLVNRAHWNYGEGGGIAPFYYANKVNNRADILGENGSYSGMINDSNAKTPEEAMRDNFGGNHGDGTLNNYDELKDNYDRFTEKIAGGINTDENGNYVSTKVDHLENINSDSKIKGVFAANLDVLGPNPTPDPTNGATHSAGGKGSIDYVTTHNKLGTQISVVNNISSGAYHLFYQGIERQAHEKSSYTLIKINNSNKTIGNPEIKNP